MGGTNHLKDKIKTDHHTSLFIIGNRSPSKSAAFYNIFRMNECIDSLGMQTGSQHSMPTVAIGKRRYRRKVRIELHFCPAKDSQGLSVCNLDFAVHHEHSLVGMNVIL